MSLLETLNEDLKKAIKEKNEIKISTIRQIKNHITNIEIKKARPLNDEEIIEIIFSLVKAHNESIESFKAGNRPDLVEKEEKELSVLKTYLPKQFSEEELRKIVSDTIKEVNATTSKDMGKVMAVLMPKIKGRADGAKVKILVEEFLKN
ncbi:MAG: GatB/YqeY domain-containing protein [Candidatus Goldbacteria bacterium]|nr:GatB/YqeY domain-containing protein [Candidatus Goldiibacteriota bacterium]